MNIQLAIYRTNSDDYNRYEQFLSEVKDSNKLEWWTSTSKFKMGDLVLFYFGAPKKSIVAVGFVSSNPELEYNEFDWTQKEKEYFCNFEPVWLLKKPIQLPTQNATLQEWYSKKPYRSSRKLQENIAGLLLNEIFIDNPEVKNIREIQETLNSLNDTRNTEAEDKIDQLTVQDYLRAFQSIKENISPVELEMLRANLEAPNHTVTATNLAQIMNFANFNAANLKYGTFAGKLCNFFKLKPLQNLYVLVYFNKINNEWHWTLKEQVISAISKLELFELKNIPNIITEINSFKAGESNIENTSTETIVQSRIGQGFFRTILIEYWQGCSVTGCQFVDILKASHIKPWRYSNNNERLNGFNGLLLVPNLDSLFDSGYISFDNDGNILISKLLVKGHWARLGVEESLKLRKVEEGHKEFLDFHRNNIFKELA